MASNEADLGGRLFPGGESQRGLGSDPANTPQAPELGAQVLESATTQNTTPSVEAHPPGLDRRGFLKIGLGVGAALGATALGRLIIPGLSSDGDGSGDGGGSSNQPILTGETPTQPAGTTTTLGEVNPGSTATPRAESTPKIESPKEKPALKEVGNKIGKKIGTHISPSQTQAPDRNILIEQFSSITPSVLNWETLYGKNGFDNPDFSAMDRWYKFAKDNGISIVGQPLIFHGILPKGFENQQFTKESMTNIITTHVRRLVERYPDMDEWVGVNEAVWVLGGGNGYKDNIFHKVLGSEYIPLVYRTIKEFNPKAKKTIGDFGIETAGPKADFMFELAKKLHDQGLLDGVQAQMHVAGPLLDKQFKVKLGHPDPNNFPSDEALAAQFERYNQIGMKFNYGEVDIDQSEMTGTLEQNNQLQAEVNGRIVRVSASAPNCDRITYWGYDDRFSWLIPFGAKAPCLYDGKQFKLSFDTAYAELKARSEKID